MDYYKKKNLKFNSEVGREIRYAETVRARESSRFKRLSMLRCIDEDVEQPSFEKPKERLFADVKKPVSRLETLRKWKHEKIIKKQLEKKNSIRPFYAGAQSLKNSYQVPSCNSSVTSKIQNISKQALPSNLNQTSRIPNSSRQVSSSNSLQTSRIPNSSKQVSSSATLTSRIPNNSKLLSVIPKVAKNTQHQVQRIPSSNQEFVKKPTAFGNSLKASQVPKSKIQTGTPSSAPSANGSSSNKGFQSRIAKPASVVQRRIPVQSKLPVSNNQKPNAALSKKPPSVLPVGVKLPTSSISQKSIPGLKKPGLVSKVDLKKAPQVLEYQKQDKKAFSESKANRSNKEPPDVKKIMPKEKNVEPESGSENNIEGLSDLFDCDVSIIKHTPSFAPENFTFQPPSELLDFAFDYSILEKIKEFISRTSTPTKKPAQNSVNEVNKEIVQTPSESEDAMINISTSSKQGLKDDEKAVQEQSENLDIETNISTPTKQTAQSSVNENDDKEIVQTPSKNEDAVTNISTSSNQHAEFYKNDKDGKETMQEQSENQDIEANISASKPGQGSHSDKDDDEITKHSYENFKSEVIVSSLSEDPNQDFENVNSKINVRDPHNSNQPPDHNSDATFEEKLLKDRENLVTETEKITHLPLDEGVDCGKCIKTMQPNAFQNAFQKRRSILKKSTLVSISEADDNLSLSPIIDAAEDKENVFVTPRRSRRISKLISIDESPSTTPRRSLRLQKKVSKNVIPDGSHSKGASCTNLTQDFDQLTLEDFDKMNPEDYLCDFDDSPEKIKSKKISLLYSPDKRKSIRRSIRGDLMSFSPRSPKV